LRREYDFASMSGGVRGKYVARLRAGSNVVLLDDDVAAAFPSSTAVNDALRALLALASQIRRPPAGSRRSTTAKPRIARRHP
jgi:hypothetical protein